MPANAITIMYQTRPLLDADVTKRLKITKKMEGDGAMSVSHHNIHGTKMIALDRNSNAAQDWGGPLYILPTHHAMPRLCLQLIYQASFLSRLWPIGKEVHFIEKPAEGNEIFYLWEASHWHLCKARKHLSEIAFIVRRFIRAEKLTIITLVRTLLIQHKLTTMDPPSLNLATHSCGKFGTMMHILDW